MLSKFEDFDFSLEVGGIDGISSFKYLGTILDQKWNWKLHISSLSRKLGHELSVFNRILHMLDKRTFNGLVLQHLDHMHTTFREISLA